MEQQAPNFLNINKPAGPTSHDIVNKIRRITGIRKVGHAGTLDPFASGVLIVAIGREATREIEKFQKQDKEYAATLFLGAETNTYDRMGIKTSAVETRRGASLRSVESVLKSFIGKQQQIPPMFSAKKIKGKKLYELARKGIEVERQPCDIEIYDIAIEKYEHPILKIKVKCSTGTYIRTLAFDIGRKLGTGAYLEELVRTSVGRIKIDDAINIDDLNADNWKQRVVDTKIIF